MAERLQCEFVIRNKNRRCGMTRSQAAKYCSEHSTLLEEGNRIPCPLDPSHTIWEYSLRTHLRKCNKGKLVHSNDNKPYYAKDVNVRTDHAILKPEDQKEREQWILDALPILREYMQADPAVRPPESVKENTSMQSHRFPQLDEDDTVGRKFHAIQQSSLIQNMIDYGIIDLSSANNFVEFGCGRAELSRYINQVLVASANATIAKPSHFVLIDRSTNRMKFDTKLAKDTTKINPKAALPIVSRARIDIKDLKLSPALNKDTSYIATSKHLCGVATDLALHSLINTTSPNQLQGMCIAMCCRHACNAASYTNPNFIAKFVKDKQISYEKFFYALTKIATWATSIDKSNATEDITHFTALPLDERLELGLVARKIIDQGRCEYINKHLNQHNFKAKLITYCTPTVSKENVALLVYKNQQ